MEESTPVHRACQSSPAAASDWPVSAGPSSPAAEPPSAAAALQPETLRAPPQWGTRPGPRLLGGCCVWPASQSGACRPGGSRAGGGGRREKGGRSLIYPAGVLLLLGPQGPLWPSPVLSGYKMTQKHTLRVTVVLHNTFHFYLDRNMDQTCPNHSKHKYLVKEKYMKISEWSIVDLQNSMVFYTLNKIPWFGTYPPKKKITPWWV